MNAATWYQGGHFITVNDLKIFFRRQGKGQPLVCIHGFPSSSWDFEGVWDELITRFDAIAPDLIGLGKSAKPQQSITVTTQADMIESLMGQLGIPAAHILAHDLGDTVAQELLARQRNKTSKVNWLSCIFMNGGIFPETHRPLLIQKLLISPFGGVLAQLLSRRSFEKNMRRVFSEAHPPSEDFLYGTWNLVTADQGKSMIPRLIRYMSEREKHRERWVIPLVRGVVPIRLIDGEDDPISGKHMADRFNEVVPDADIVLLKHSGHYPHLETPEEVVKAVFDFHDRMVQHP